MMTLPRHQPTRAQRRQLDRDNAKLPKRLEPVHRSDWPLELHSAANLLAVYRSRAFLVQKFTAPAPAICRLSVIRSQHDGSDWAAGISWDELQAIKNEVGYFAHCAVEVFPAIRDLVNVTNMRHLWVLPEAPAFAWRRG